MTRSLRNAFTLIELLVVVAIITALLAILLPSMGRAVEVAQSAVCGSNQRQMGQGVLAYAVDHNRVYPPDRVLASGLDNDLLQTWHSRYMYQGTSWKNLGIVLNAGLLPNDDGQVFFCPSMQTISLTPAGYAPWPTPNDTYNPGNTAIRQSYLYNPHIKDPAGNYNRITTRVSDRQMPTMIVDVMTHRNRDNIAHASLGGFNRMGFDMSVHFAQSETVLDNLTTLSANYPLFIDSLELLEQQ